MMSNTNYRHRNTLVQSNTSFLTFLIKHGLKNVKRKFTRPLFYETEGMGEFVICDNREIFHKIA